MDAPRRCSPRTLEPESPAPRAQVDWWEPANAPPQPRKLGVTVYEDFPLQDVLDYIDWNPFFQVSCLPFVLDVSGLWTKPYSSVDWTPPFRGTAHSLMEYSASFLPNIRGGASFSGPGLIRALENGTSRSLF